jgi:hypothetical protein
MISHHWAGMAPVVDCRWIRPVIAVTWEAPESSRIEARWKGGRVPYQSADISHALNCSDR